MLTRYMRTEKRTYDHGREIIRAVVVWPCAGRFERLWARCQARVTRIRLGTEAADLITVGDDLVHVDAVEILFQSPRYAILVIHKDLKGSKLVEVEGSVVTSNRRNLISAEVPEQMSLLTL